METRLTVARDGSGDFGSIGEALRAADALAPGRVRISVGPGEWREKLRIMRPGLELTGAGADSTRILWNDHATKLLPDGNPMGTFNSYTLYVGAQGVRLSDLSVLNDAGDGRVVGQAVALYADADRFEAERCCLSGRQDTLLTGPLPKNPPPAGTNLIHPVAGLGDDEPRLPFRMIFRGCLIEGDVDFIFGSAAALFDDCLIRSRSRGDEPGWIAAPSTYPGQTAGFVFRHCRLVSEPGCGPVFLARPWRITGRAVYIDCEMGSHITPGNAGEAWLPSPDRDAAEAINQILRNAD